MIWRILRFILAGLGWLALAATAVAIWLHYNPSRGQTSLYATALVPFAVIAGVAAVVVFAVLRHWVVLAVAVVVTMALCYTQIPLWRAQTAPAGERFTVVSANLLYGQADVDVVARHVIDADADLLSLQEVTPEALARVRASAIARHMPYSYAIPMPLAGGTALFSTRPLTDTREVDRTTVLHNLKARTDLPGAADTQVVAIHPGAPTPGHTGVWLREIDLLKNHLHALPRGRVIAVGDFNGTWDQVQYRALLQNGFLDATDQAGAGFSPSWPTDKTRNHPLMGIDHLISRGFVADSFTTFYIPGSDHRGLVVSLVAS